MKIFLFGNLRCGKSTLAKAIIEVMPDAPFISIDEFRKKYGDGTQEGDNLSKKHFLDAIKDDNTFQVIECVGLGPTGVLLRDHIQNFQNQIVIVLIKTNIEVCLQRAKSKNFQTQTPYPKVGETIEQKIERFDGQINDGTLYNFWNVLPSMFYFQYSNNSNNFQTNFPEFLKSLFKIYEQQ